ncbi:MAG TPA: hypothetical protein VFF65_03915 [Phycisphaerales bacterium]|nr:hypothetical protein [Phycisphaerales bacterium]
MSNRRNIKAEECEVYLASPTKYEECVVLVESAPGLLLTLTDESRDGKCVVEFPATDEGRADWTMALNDLRAVLEKAERLLVPSPPT